MQTKRCKRQERLNKKLSKKQDELKCNNAALESENEQLKSVCEELTRALEFQNNNITQIVDEKISAEIDTWPTCTCMNIGGKM